jgi:hypothetical protein
VYLGRIDPTVYPYSQSVFIDTRMGPQISPAGWLLNNADCSAGGNLQFWEYGSVTLTGQPADTSQRLACSRQLTPAHAAQWSDPAFVLTAGPRPQEKTTSRAGGSYVRCAVIAAQRTYDPGITGRRAGGTAR